MAHLELSRCFSRKKLTQYSDQSVATVNAYYHWRSSVGPYLRITGRFPDYVEKILQLGVDRAGLARHSHARRGFSCTWTNHTSLRATISTCHGHVNGPATETSRLLRRRLGIGCRWNWSNWGRQRHSDEKSRLVRSACLTYVTENTAI